MRFELSSTQPEYRPGQAVSVGLKLANPGAPTAPCQLVIALELGGSFYFYPTYSQNLTPLDLGSLPTFEMTTPVEFLGFSSPVFAGGPLALNWYGLVYLPSGEFLSDLASVSFTIRGA